MPSSDFYRPSGTFSILRKARQEESLMATNQFVVTARLVDDRSFTWDCESFDAAKQQAVDIGRLGFFVGSDRNPVQGVEFIAPHRISELKAAASPDHVCTECHEQMRAQGDSLCIGCRTNLNCQKCRIVGRQTGQRFCTSCIERHMCQRCKEAERLAGERYCSDCKKQVLREMRETGYLSELTSTVPYKRRMRTEPSEDARGDWDNAVRASEER